MVASADLGNLGPRDGPPVEFDWKFQWILLLSYAPWLILAALLLMRRKNRTWRICWLIVPLGLVLTACHILPRLFGVAPQETDQIRDFLDAVGFGLTCVWGWGDWIGSRTRLLTMCKTALWMLPVSALCALFQAGPHGPIASFAIVVMIIAVFSALMILAALNLAAIRCGGRYKPWRFSLWLLVWLVLGAVIVVVVSFSFIEAHVFTARFDWSFLFKRLPEVLLGGAIWGVILWAITLPFLILAFSSSFYRERFCGVCGVAGKDEPPPLPVGQEQGSP